MTDYMLKRRNLAMGIEEEEVEETKPNRIKNYGKKRAAQQREYRKVVKEMLEENNLCEIKEDGCTVIATGLHHQKKRSPKTMLDKQYLKRSCDNCNYWCEEHPKEAIEKGHSVSRHIKVYERTVN